MNKNEIFDSISYIDTDLIEEAADITPDIKSKRIKWISFAACLCICIAATAVIGLSKSRPSNNIKSQSESSTSNVTSPETTDKAEPSSSIDVTENQTIPDLLTDGDLTESRNQYVSHSETTESADNQTTKAPLTSSEKSEDGHIIYGGSHDYFMIPAIPKNNIKVTGEKLTDAQAKEYFDENKTSIISALGSSGVKTDNVRISDNGYSHLIYDGSTMDYIELRQNFRDYLVYNGNDLIAIITLYKENGKIYSTPAFGAEWFKEYNSLLNRYKGQKLLYIYVGSQEIFITPDNKSYSTFGKDASNFFEGLDDPYNYFYNDGATYTP